MRICAGSSNQARRTSWGNDAAARFARCTSCWLRGWRRTILDRLRPQTAPLPKGRSRMAGDSDPAGQPHRESTLVDPEEAARRHLVRPVSTVDADEVPFAPIELLVDRAIRHAEVDVATVDHVEQLSGSRVRSARNCISSSEKMRSMFVASTKLPRARGIPTVLRNHLEQWQLVRVSRDGCGGRLPEPPRSAPRSDRPPRAIAAHREDPADRRADSTRRGRARIEAVPLALRCKRVEEDLCPRERIAAVVVVTRRCDDAEIWLLFSGHHRHRRGGSTLRLDSFGQVRPVRPGCSS